MDKITLITELWKRLISGGDNTPDFFKKIKAYSTYILLAIAVAFAGEYLDLYTIPERLSLALIAVAGYFLGTGSTSVLPVKDKAKAGMPLDGPGGGQPLDPPPTKP